MDPIRLGTMLFSLVEPHRGAEREFHRWYERDHFYAGCLTGPWCFAGRRWVATRALKALRAPAGAPDLARGSFLHTYWILDGRHDDFLAWAVPQVHALHAADRMFAASVQVHTGFYRRETQVGRDPDGVPPELALDHPYAGLLVTRVERPRDVEPEAWWRGLRDDHLPGLLAGSPAAQCIGFGALPMPEDAPANVPRAPLAGDSALLLFFLEANPASAAGMLLARHRAGLTASGAKLAWAAPFVATVPGTDRYLDELG